jgi:hypothetical protein
MRKNSTDDIEYSIESAERIYNNTYHRSIKRSPKNALQNYTDYDSAEPNQELKGISDKRRC